MCDDRFGTWPYDHSKFKHPQIHTFHHVMKMRELFERLYV